MAHQPNNPTTERDARPDERCSCGAPAVTVFLTERFGDVAYCGEQHPADERCTAPVTEDYRVTAARKLLAASQQATAADEDYSGAHWHGVLEATALSLLAVIDEGVRPTQTPDDAGRLERIEGTLAELTRALTTIAAAAAEERLDEPNG